MLSETAGGWRDQRGADRLYADAVALWDRGREMEAVERLDAALRERPDFAEALCMGAYILNNRGKREVALRFYRRAVNCNRKLPSAWSNMGKLLFQLDRHAEALEAFETAAALIPAEADVHNSRAGALRALGRLGESETAAREALRLRPNFPEAALNLGTALLKLGRAEEALEFYRRAEALRPRFADALCGDRESPSRRRSRSLRAGSAQRDRLYRRVVPGRAAGEPGAVLRLWRPRLAAFSFRPAGRREARCFARSCRLRICHRCEATARRPDGPAGLGL